MFFIGTFKPTVRVPQSTLKREKKRLKKKKKRKKRAENNMCTCWYFFANEARALKGKPVFSFWLWMRYLWLVEVKLFGDIYDERNTGAHKFLRKVNKKKCRERDRSRIIFSSGLMSHDIIVLPCSNAGCGCVEGEGDSSCWSRNLNRHLQPH